MADQKVNIKVTTQGATKAKQELGGLSGSINKMGKAVGIASAAYFGAQGLISGLGSVIRLAGEQEQAEKKLAFALGGTSQALLNQATALQKTTRFGDEATIAQMGFLASIGFTEEKIQDVIPVAMDLAEATGMSLESAVRNTAKTFSGMAGELGELVPQIRELTSEEMKAGEAVRVMGELFSGQAKSGAETLTGSIEQMNNAIGDAGEALGAVLAPAIVGIANIVTSFANGLGDIINFREGLAELAKDFEILTESQFKVIQLEQALKTMTQEDIIAKINELGFSIDENNTSFNEMAITSAILTEEQKANAEMANMLLEAYENAPKAVNDTKTAFDLYVESQKKLLKGQEQEKENIKRLKKEYPELANALGVVNKETEKNVDLEKERFQTSLSGIRSMIKGLLAQAIAGAIAKEVGTKGFAGLITGTAAAVAVTALFDEYVPKFAQGGIVPGTGNQDTVPAMLTPGELILNQAQQENLVSSGVTINIQGNMIGNEEFVRDVLIPEISNANNMELA